MIPSGDVERIGKRLRFGSDGLQEMPRKTRMDGPVEEGNRDQQFSQGAISAVSE